MNRPPMVVSNPKRARIAAYVVLAFGFFLLWQAFEGRGSDTPKALRWLTFW